ncbi:hypothetical protein FRC07_008688, partial [Ceratobasidium sp. 392]
ILFRRISPVESKRYAFFQNFCALLFIIALIVRAIMALAQAQNQIETRSGAGDCGSIPNMVDLRILVRHQDNFASPAFRNPQTGQGYDVTVQVSSQRVGQYQCTSESQDATAALDLGNWFQVFNCATENNAYTQFSNSNFTITTRSTNGTSLDAMQLPDIWFANFADTFRDASGLDQQGFMSSVVPWLVPPWQMVGGKNIEGTVGLAKRRFITSSVFRDIVASLKPYAPFSLHDLHVRKLIQPDILATKDVASSADNLTATATLTPFLVSSLSYLNSPAYILDRKTSSASIPSICAYIDDYRSSTIFDAIGSIGGLLAILQGVHILLFGRPMFWGLTALKQGAKLISPFGIFGRCHSRGFRRRLRERYHRQPTAGQPGDAAEAIRINAFLRDFVIDFGPADTVEEQDAGAGRSGKRELRLQANHAGFHGNDEHDVDDSL